MMPIQIIYYYNYYLIFGFGFPSMKKDLHNLSEATERIWIELPLV